MSATMQNDILTLKKRVVMALALLSALQEALEQVKLEVRVLAGTIERERPAAVREEGSDEVF